MRTSQDDPLQIDFVSVPDSTGRIGMTFCPGKKQRGAMTGDWNRDLILDLDAIQIWGASVIVNLIEDHEMVELEVRDAERHVPVGIDYIRLPIPDYGVPDRAWHQQWQLQGPQLRDRLRAGESIVLHCKGGLGRTGMVAARILVELGCTPQEAILAVREAREGAIETAGQETYVRRVGRGDRCGIS
ncbi:MAG: cyclin-dependent kinase inhibitor 3 family protein [Halioglobus sp.]